MEIDTKVRENHQHQQGFLSENNNYDKLPPYMKNETPLDVPFSDEASSTYLQEFHDLDHQFHANGSSTNPMFGIQTPCFEPFDAFPDSGYNNTTSNFDVYECKPLADNYNGGHGQVNNNYNKLPPYMKNETPSDVPFSDKASSSYLQEFHDLDHQFHGNGSSTNPMFGVQTPCFEPFDAFPYSGYNNSSSNFDVYECKPFADNCNGEHGQVTDNFQSGGGYLNHQAMMGSDHQSQMPYTYQEMNRAVNFAVPDEVSCVNNSNVDNGCYKNKVGCFNKSRLHSSSKKTLKGGKKSTIVKGQWTIEEDRLLIRLVEQYGIRKWSLIAHMLPGRIGKQCRERWHNHLRPDIKKDIWSEEEDKALIEAHAEIGNKWAEIAKRLPGRTENSIKNHWNATKRRQFSKRKCRSKYPRGSLLQDYIKSLNLDHV